MTQYILNVHKWKSCEIGEGITRMLNKEGYMCCLGQFGKQKGVPKDVLLNSTDPGNTSNLLNKRYDKAFVQNGKNTKLAKTLISINDERKLTPKQRVDAIRAELEKKGHTLKVIGYRTLK